MMNRSRVGAGSAVRRWGVITSLSQWRVDMEVPHGTVGVDDVRYPPDGLSVDGARTHMSSGSTIRPSSHPA
jgi:hypothetical protein